MLAWLEQGHYRGGRKRRKTSHGSGGARDIIPDSMIEVFVDHFRKLHNKGTEEVLDDDTNIPFSGDSENELINSEFMEDKIWKCIKKLKVGKAASADKMPNEFILLC